MNKELSALVLLTVTLFACSKDDAVLSFVTENDQFAASVSQASSPEEARRTFDAKKDELKTKFDAVKGVRGFQVKKETMDKLASSVMASTTKVCSLEIKAILDNGKRTKYRALCEDYSNMLKM